MEEGVSVERGERAGWGGGYKGAYPYYYLLSVTWLSPGVPLYYSICLDKRTRERIKLAEIANCLPIASSITVWKSSPTFSCHLEGIP